MKQTALNTACPGGPCARSLLIAASLAAAPAAFAQQQLAGIGDLSLAQLREVVVTTVSLRAEGLDRAAASVYVISADAILRSGATTIPEALRLAPTLNVARADGNQYAISARGFNNVLANKLLVVIDGRAVYSPLFSGVFWEAQDVTLDDIDRIEVVTGPSTALWGSNAVNALIHIVTKSAAATQGTALTVNAGSREYGGGVRYGGAAGERGHFRLYAKTYERKETQLSNGAATGDAAEGTQIGFRTDWVRDFDSLTLQGDAYEARIHQGALPSRHLTGANVLGRWDRSLGEGSDVRVQVYLDRTTRDQPPSVIEVLNTVDAVAQYGFRPFDAHRMLVGAGYRGSQDSLTTFTSIGFNPTSRSLHWGRVFAQDEIDVSQRLTLTLAASAESNPYTRAQLLPSLRLAYRPSADATWWAAASRAARAPSRIDREFVQGPPVRVAGGPDFVSEISKVYELGYRSQPTSSLSYSLTLFQQDHEGLRSLAPTPAGLQFQNGIEGRSRGAEAWAVWHVSDAWRLDAGFTTLRQQLNVIPGFVDMGGMQSLGNDPSETWSLRSSVDLTPSISWELSVRHVGKLPAPAVPAYTATDTRLAWSVSPTAEVALVVKNLFDPKHAEWGVAANRVEIERSVLLQLKWRL
jgi:iron complex outermembrane receptor protein